MLIKCTECELQVSDKAQTCPHCGYPLKAPKKYQKSYTKRKNHRRLPNGFGQISDLHKPSLRKPFRAMVTVGKLPNGRPKCQILGYYETYNDAYAALVDYNRNPYDLSLDVTMQELYDEWLPKHCDTNRSPSTKTHIEAAWKYCDSIKKMKVKDVRARHVKACMDTATSAGVKSRIKSACNQLLDYALEFEIVDRNYARTFKLSEEIIKEAKTVKRPHYAFTDEELSLFWEHRSLSYIIDIILIQSYMGWRPQEIVNLELENVDLTNGYIIGGIKTKAGKNRKVPIHDCIYDIVKEKYNEGIELGTGKLVNSIDTPDNFDMSYEKYRYRYEKIIDVLGMDPKHKPHDPRKTFVTMCKKYNVDDFAIKTMVGHAITDITEVTYTERGVDWLRKELNKVKSVV